MTKSANNAVEIKIAYIGGWAHRLINDLTLCEHLTGHVVSCHPPYHAFTHPARWSRFGVRRDGLLVRSAP